MTAPSAAARVAAWPSMSREPGSIYRLQIAGVLVEIGDAYPVWQEDEAAARRFLRATGFPANGPVVDLEPAAP
jgi:hypothetical protein